MLLLTVSIIALLVQAKSIRLGFDVRSERMEIEYFDPTYADLSVWNYKYNRTTATFNLTALFKRGISERDLGMVKGYKLLSNRYRLDILQFNATVKDSISMRYFDVTGLCRNHIKPAVTWPLKVGVRYQIRDWIPESGQFPPGIPEGRWKISLQLLEKNSCKIVTSINWYMAVKYRLKVED